MVSRVGRSRHGAPQPAPDGPGAAFELLERPGVRARAAALRAGARCAAGSGLTARPRDDLRSGNPRSRVRGGPGAAPGARRGAMGLLVHPPKRPRARPTRLPPALGGTRTRPRARARLAHASGDPIPGRTSAG